MRAAICYETAVGYKVIVVEEKGNPAYTGAILTAKYITDKKVRSLVDLGDLLLLGEELCPQTNLGHYIFYNRSEEEVERLIQERVCIAKSRDTRLYDLGVLRKKFEKDTREYESKNPRLVYVCEGVDYVYVYSKGSWKTWGVDSKDGVFKNLVVHYDRYIKNLLFRDEMSKLTTTEKRKLKLL